MRMALPNPRSPRRTIMMRVRTNLGLRPNIGVWFQTCLPAGGRLGMASAICLIFFSGCQEPVLITSGAAVPPAVEAQAVAEPFTLQGGDVVRIGFPGTPALDTSQTIRGDGKVNLPMVGEVQAAGKTPVALEKELVAMYAPHLVSKEVTVTVVSASYAVFVSGAVLRPGKVLTDHPISAFEAIMEAGGFDEAKANIAAVVVVRRAGEKTQNFTLNLKHVLDGRQNEPFMLRRSDIIYVPEKFSWF